MVSSAARAGVETETATPALYAATLTHTRTQGVRHSFRYRTYLWLVDVDDLPRLPIPLRPFARFRARDHVGDPARTIRANLDDWLGEHGIELGGGRVVMLTAAAVLGHVFNPISLFWCRFEDGSPACVVAEVHNTYGGRHRYLLRPDADGRAEVPKEFYVSPFFPVDGRYTLSVPVPGRRLRVAVSLTRPGGPDGRERTVFAAALTGRRSPARSRDLVRLMLRHPLPTVRVAALIRYEGILLWLRGLPVIHRPASRSREAS